MSDNIIKDVVIDDEWKRKKIKEMREMGREDVFIKKTLGLSWPKMRELGWQS